MSRRVLSWYERTPRTLHSHGGGGLQGDWGGPTGGLGGGPTGGLGGAYRGTGGGLQGDWGGAYRGTGGAYRGTVGKDAGTNVRVLTEQVDFNNGRMIITMNIPYNHLHLTCN